MQQSKGHFKNWLIDWLKRWVVQFRWVRTSLEDDFPTPARLGRPSDPLCAENSQRCESICTSIRTGSVKTILHEHFSMTKVCARWIPIMPDQKMKDCRCETLNGKKSPQIAGLRPLMCSQIFQPPNFNANQLNILVHLQLLWLLNAYHFKVLLHLLPFGRNLRGSLEIPNFGD